MKNGRWGITAISRRNWAKEYKKIQSNYCNKSRRILQNNLRSSREHYENSEEKLKAIKEKYKNGFTENILKEFVSEIC